MLKLCVATECRVGVEKHLELMTKTARIIAFPPIMLWFVSPYKKETASHQFSQRETVRCGVSETCTKSLVFYALQFNAIVPYRITGNNRSVSFLDNATTLDSNVIIVIENSLPKYVTKTIGYDRVSNQVSRPHRQHFHCIGNLLDIMFFLGLVNGG